MSQHKMRLTPRNFAQMKNGTKRNELRVNDEKRQLLEVGDEIEFQNLAHPTGVIDTRITRLDFYPDFHALYAGVQSEYPDYAEDEFVAGMREHYPSEEEQKYGAVAIWVELKSDH